MFPFDKRAENKEMPESKFNIYSEAGIYVIRYHLMSNNNFMRISLITLVELYLFHTTRNVDPDSLMTVHERESVINRALNQRL